MSRFSVTVVQQSQERLKELTNKVDGVMASGISLAEDLMDSGDIYVNELEKCLMELAEITHNVDSMQEAISEVDIVLRDHSNEQMPPDLAECFKSKLQDLSKGGYDPKSHPRIVQFIQQVREEEEDSEEEMETQDNGDTDIVLGHVQKSLHCPLTKKYFEEPVTSKTCNHSYSKAAILEHIKKRPTCPVCNISLRENDLKKDDKLQRKVWKAKKQDKKKKRASLDGSHVVKL